MQKTVRVSGVLIGEVGFREGGRFTFEGTRLLLLLISVADQKRNQ